MLGVKGGDGRGGTARSRLATTPVRDSAGLVGGSQPRQNATSCLWRARGGDPSAAGATLEDLRGGPVSYRERLVVPLTWWALGGLFALTLAIAVGVYLGPVWGSAAGLVVCAVTVALFTSSATLLRVDAEGFHVGRALLDVRSLGQVQPLSAEQTDARSGPDADARAFLLLRPYVRTAVEVGVEDQADPAPYWLVSSRRPTELAAALDAVRGPGRSDTRLTR